MIELALLNAEQVLAKHEAERRRIDALINELHAQQRRLRIHLLANTSINQEA